MRPETLHNRYWLRLFGSFRRIQSCGIGFSEVHVSNLKKLGNWVKYKSMATPKTVKLFVQTSTFFFREKHGTHTSRLSSPCKLPNSTQTRSSSSWVGVRWVQGPLKSKSASPIKFERVALGLSCVRINWASLGLGWVRVDRILLEINWAPLRLGWVQVSLVGQSLLYRASLQGLWGLRMTWSDSTWLKRDRVIPRVRVFKSWVLDDNLGGGQGQWTTPWSSWSWEETI